VPNELLLFLLAFDAIPDIFYTVSNVIADLAVTSVAERAGEAHKVEAEETHRRTAGGSEAARSKLNG